jgi:hypothetical protein
MGAGMSLDALKKTKIPSLSRNEQQFHFDWASVHEPNVIKKLYMICFIKLHNDITPCTAHFLVLTCSRNIYKCSKYLI